MRLSEGVRVIRDHSLSGALRGRAEETQFWLKLSDAGVVDGTALGNADANGRKWRSALTKLGFLTLNLNDEKLANFSSPSLTSVPDFRERVIDLAARAELTREFDLTKPGFEITPLGSALALADVVRQEQDVLLRALAAYQLPSPIEPVAALVPFSPLEVCLRFALRSPISREELAAVVNLIHIHGETESERLRSLFLGRTERERQETARSIFEDLRSRQLLRANDDSLSTYADANGRYLLATGLFAWRKQHLSVVEEQRQLVERLLPTLVPTSDPVAYLERLWRGHELPVDDSEQIIPVIAQLGDALSRQGETVPALPSGASLVELQQVRLNLEDRLQRARESEYANLQASKWSEISDLMLRLSTPQSSRQVSEAPLRLEWVVWRSFLAINSIVNQPGEARRFKVDQNFEPVHHAPGNGPDMVFEFPRFTLIVEVTLTANSRQEANEGEPVRRHVAAYLGRNKKPVYGLFLAQTIDSNTAETFRHGSWYRNDDTREALQIVPLPISAFAYYFRSSFARHGAFSLEQFERYLLEVRAQCNLEAREWKTDAVERLARLTITC